MPLYKTELRFATDMPGQPARRWRNTFYFDSSSAAGAADNLRTGWEEWLRAGARDRVYAYEVYASSVLAGDDDFAVVQIVPGNQRGNLPTPAAEPYLPKACIAVTLGVLASRPSRKFWRPGLTELDIVAGVSVTTTLADAIRTAFTNFVVDFAGSLVDPDGQLLNSVQRLNLTTREFGREATVDVPLPPPLG